MVEDQHEIEANGQPQTMEEDPSGEQNYFGTMVQKMEEFREQCVAEGKLLEAEEAQSKIEELKD